MRILLVNKFLYPKGGSETYVIKLGAYLESRGHEVQYFGMADERNTLGNRIGAYAAPMDFHAGVRKNLTAPMRIIYNAEARRQFRKLLDDFQPDIVHLNNIHFHLTPSIIMEANHFRRKHKPGLKIIYTAHDYQLVCPSHGLFDPQMNICEKCLGGNYTHCLRTKCVKNSYSKSLLGMIDAYWWKLSSAYAHVDAIICCSEFLKRKLDTQQRFRSKTIAIHNFVDDVISLPDRREDGGYVLEFGHLSRDKGTLTLLEVCRQMPETHFVFAGFGPAVDDIKQQPNAEYVGFKTGEELKELVSHASVTVHPSECYENCPFSVIESQMYGTPVLGAISGGIPELIDEGNTGELFEPGNAVELERKLRLMLKTPGTLEKYSNNCRNAYFETSESYYEKLMGVYGV